MQPCLVNALVLNSLVCFFQDRIWWMLVSCKNPQPLRFEDQKWDAEIYYGKTLVVPETLLKKRKARSELRAKQIKAALLEKQNAKTKRATIFKRAEQYVKEYRKAEADELRLARDARKHGNFYVPSEAKLAIVMRIRGINGLHPRVRKVLQLLRLRQINNAT